MVVAAANEVLQQRFVIIPFDEPNTGAFEPSSGVVNCNNDDFHEDPDTKTTREIFSQCHRVVPDIFYNSLGFRCLTSVQRATIPFLLENRCFDRYSSGSGDAIISAPTGQGKTLCYVIPIVSALFYRITPQISTIVLAPTRELVVQIALCFSSFCSSPSLTFQSNERAATSDHVFSSSVLRPLFTGDEQTPVPLAENTLLFHHSTRDPLLPRLRVSCLSGDVPLASERAEICGVSESLFSDEGPSDIVVATPGRFVEHCQRLTKSAVLTLSTICASASNSAVVAPVWNHVKWIVLDEADRLLEESYQDWVEEIHRITRMCTTPPRKIVAAATMTHNPEKLSLLGFCHPLFFATSEKINCFIPPPGLKQYWCPCPALTNFYGLTSLMTKPLVVVYLLHQLYTEERKEYAETAIDKSPARKKRKMKEIIEEGKGLSRSTDTSQNNKNSDSNVTYPLKTIIFCRSRETAQRLSVLLNLHFGSSAVQLPPVTVSPFSIVAKQLKSYIRTRDYDYFVQPPSMEVTGSRIRLNVSNFTSSLSKQERSKMIKLFEKSNFCVASELDRPIDVLVCTHVLSRGLDLSKLDVVINYDLPDTLRSYIHCIGRTARAGRSGTSITMVTQDEVRSFSQMLKRNVLPSTNTSAATCAVHGGETASTIEKTSSTSLWDLVHKHRVPKSAIKVWLQETQHNENSEQKEILNSTSAAYSTSNNEDEFLAAYSSPDSCLPSSSYYKSLLNLLDSEIRSR